MTSILLLGFAIGLRHALEADHVAAVAVLTTRARTVSEAVPVGVMWGIGHTVTLFAFAGLVMASGRVIPGGVAEWLEAAVGA
ncbi:MAG: HoxN/HupN/NixA family nickel/cobalt transporter, partial [Alphaproteobacteria bacterium]